MFLHAGTYHATVDAADREGVEMKLFNEVEVAGQGETHNRPGYASHVKTVLDQDALTRLATDVGTMALYLMRLFGDDDLRDIAERWK